MVSRDGFDTWLEYEVRIAALVVLVALVVGAGRILLALLDRSPLSTIDLVLYGGLVLVAGSIAAAWWLGRSHERAQK